MCMQKIVTVGGGHGQGAILYALKEYCIQHPSQLKQEDLTGIPSTSDTGGHTGRQLESRIPKDEKGNYLPIGDIRECLVALSNNKLKREEFNYRIKEGDNKGAVVGNIRIDAMYEQLGDFEKAVEYFKSKEELDVRANVYPCTLKRGTLCALLEDNDDIIKGENEIVRTAIEYNKKIHEVFIEPKDIKANEKACDALMNADKIIHACGSMYTSQIPPLLVEGIAETIRINEGAQKIYIMNLMTQRGETDGYTAQDHMAAYEKKFGKNVVTHVIIHNDLMSEDLLRKYAEKGQYPVKDDLKENGYKVIRVDLINKDADMARHDPLKLAETILKL